MTAPALALHEVTKNFGGLRVLEDVSLVVGAAERRAIIGPNGAGKTTLFHIMSGMVRPTSGQVDLFGQDVTRRSAHHRVALGMARTFQITNLFPSLTVEENLILALQGRQRTKYSLLRPVSRYRSVIDNAARLLEEWQLAARRDDAVKELSYGEQRALEILLAVSQHPRILLLDEPTAGLSPTETRAVVKIIEGLTREMAIILIEHDMDVAFEVCQFVTVLHSGKVLSSGTGEQVRRDENVKSVYLGT